MGNRIKTISKASLIAIALTLIVFGAALAYTIQDSWTAPISGYTVDYLGVEVSGNQQTWTYAVTAPGTIASGQGLSHWIPEIGLCGYEVVQPLNNYSTPTNIDLCSTVYDCVSANYTVVLGNDPTTGVNGIKFEDPSVQLGPNETHVFQFTTETSTGNYVEDLITVAVKYGQKGGGGEETGDLTGPACNPNAVNLVSFEASSSAGLPYAAFLVAGTFFTFAGIIVLRRKRQ